MSLIPIAFMIPISLKASFIVNMIVNLRMSTDIITSPTLTMRSISAITMSMIYAVLRRLFGAANAQSAEALFISVTSFF